jgi:predicted MFS family arabinose efflux permease
MKPRSPWTVIVCAAAIVTLAMGVRQSFGLFLPQMGSALSISRADFGLALAIQNLALGVAQPWVGALADRHGAGRITLAGAVLYVLGLIGAAQAGSALGIHLTLGLMIGLAMSGITFTVMLGAVGRVVAPEKRGTAFGIVTAGGSLGQFLVIPGAQLMLGEIGYRMTLIALAGLIAIAAVLAIGVAGKPAVPASSEPAQSAREALREAAGVRSYWLIVAGFFVCGFQIAFIATHFPAYLVDRGIAPSVGASALALVGLFNIFGSWFFGMAADRWPKHYALSALYGARGLLFVTFLAFPVTPFTALAFAAAIGFLWLGTVPLTNGLVSQIFGVRHLSMLGGIVFLSHQVGAFFGAWMAGWLFDLMGSYDATWAVSIALSLMAAVVHLPIRDAPLVRRTALA